jgi:hypothetical protein
VADEPSTQQEEKATARRAKAEPQAEPQAETQATEAAAAPMPDVPVSQLIADSGAFLGYPSHTAAGALGGHDPDEMMSIDAAKSEVEAWLQKPVEVEGEEA